MILKPEHIRNKTILACALTWGMGHTTRLAALLSELKKNQNKIILLGSGKQIDYYKKLSSAEEYVVYNPYEVKYHQFIPLWLSILLQIPRFIKQYFDDKKLAHHYQKKFSADIILSDNCYGFYSPHAPINILMTHQIRPLFPFLRNWSRRLLEKYIYRNFSCIWVPDSDKPDERFSGVMSDAKGLNNVHYIGWLSVYKHISENQYHHEPFDELWLLSGPENEQKRFFQILYDNLISSGYSNSKIVVCGTAEIGTGRGNISYLKNPEPAVIKTLMMHSKLIRSRIGYTTLMDAKVLGILHKFDFSPTPGQYEQEYLFERNVRKNSAET
ncbi:MAG: hypothetical protein N3F09_05590 [Bacteroidia bacterium]|nr:hypothetical protein [Bacteroidia bacterium]